MMHQSRDSKTAAPPDGVSKRTPVETRLVRYDRADLTPICASLVYRCCDATGRVLYVGVTANPVERWRRHASKKSWWPDVAFIDTEPPQKEWLALARERELIRDLQPVYNVRSAVRRG